MHCPHMHARSVGVLCCSTHVHDVDSAVIQLRCAIVSTPPCDNDDHSSSTLPRQPPHPCPVYTQASTFALRADFLWHTATLTWSWAHSRHTCNACGVWARFAHLAFQKDRVHERDLGVRILQLRGHLKRVAQAMGACRPTHAYVNC